MVAFLVGGVRTPVGRYGGVLSGVRTDDLAAVVLAEVVRRAGLDAAHVDEVILGCTNQAGEDNRNVARMAVLLAGYPVDVPAITVNRLCASGLSAIISAAQMVECGAADIVVAGGVESMSRAPWVLAKPEKPFSKPGEIAETSIGSRFVNPRHQPESTMSMPETAEAVARLDGITREDADSFALLSHRRAVTAIDEGRLDAEIVPVQTPTCVVTRDEGPRRDTSMERLGSLRPVVSADGVVTAGNASSLNDGASAILVVSERAIRRFGLQPRARVVAGAAAGVEPRFMGLGPVPATEKVLHRSGWSMGGIDAVELNEAFATQSLACLRRLAIDPGIVNTDGGAIALGHPLGSSGARITITLLGRMERADARRGLATLCVGVGQGVALLVEAP
ncbi:thiolase family protein [Microbacterium saperdae]|uniref:Probable acetyl-CoA acetyltransferase n=1 Tax=Microbacterium saperdae TaxID=69368 RepID=A0A543BLC6_9MICO|nr:thiolase family protein [Microbacterium saperdae]TQL85608.1 3-oxoadipyl-CoA thiolase [Microbacterium saperdae]GGM62303.1 putative beta-ketoadipyl-CoA thiolase [Microbacterium saperdae]